MTDLKALRDRVVAGTATTMLFEDAFGDNCAWTELAYFGSLDAALRLHEALLPNTTWAAGSLGEASIFAKGGKMISTGFAPGNPARALLLAILDALIGEKE